MPSETASELSGIADELGRAYPAEEEAVESRLRTRLSRVAQSWSGSNAGYHARVYYCEFEKPPAAAVFDRSWGFVKAIEPPTRGNWVEMEEVTVVAAVLRSDRAAFDRIVAAAAAARVQLSEAREDVDDIVSGFVAEHGRAAEYLVRISERAVAVAAPTASELLATLESVSEGGPLYDEPAAVGGWTPAPHQCLEAELDAVRLTRDACASQAKAVRRLARGAQRLERPNDVAPGRSVFIGHGRASDWRTLDEFVRNELGLETDEFDRVATPSLVVVDRLKGMLDSAAMAIAVMTAEDEGPGGGRARQNVVHETGLFQGRLGFEKVILLVEEGCDVFTNVDGLVRLEFPTGRIEERFEMIRKTLEREGLLGV